MTKLSITVDDTISDALENASENTGIRKSRLIEMVIVDKKSLEEIELEYIIKDVKKQNEWHSLSDVRKELGLWKNLMLFFQQEVKNTWKN